MTDSETRWTLYRGKVWRKDGVTVSIKTVGESEFARFQIHSIRNPKDPRKVLENWLWVDEYDQVNVLVYGDDGSEMTKKDSKWIVFEQEKYGFVKGSKSLAPIGGLIEEGHNECEVSAAKREVQEELGMICGLYKVLGKYRSAANRGGGFVYVIVATECVPISNHSERINENSDLEIQKKVYLSDDELLKSVIEGRFLEVKWTAAVALTLLEKMSTKQE
eukprot:CAMPEP_0182441086 /NCGR_PEP_ID=MMETSP1172-20130603/41_1 /TAXON_ID=708627 /ORGANISM="Timspurckia oligopyrenoides, Strain CCMP3278" /LENGTH=218 /DNA_ID=CAMNT_0024635229 /DNA_START=142 /DNA_END=798 /DNA_ORIENTATION=-